MYKAGEVSVHWACCKRALQLYSLEGGGVWFDQPQDQQVVTTCSPRIVTEFLLTRLMLITMYVNVCEALIYLLDNIYITFGTKLYRQIVGIPMGTNCAPLVADLFLFCYERDFMTSLSDVKQGEIIEAFRSTSRYLDELLNIDNPYFEGMVNRIYPPELQLNKANTSDTEAPFLDLHLFQTDLFHLKFMISAMTWFWYSKFFIFGWWRSPFYLLRVYISQLIRFARVSSHVADFNARIKSLTAKLLQQGYRYHKLRKTFSKFYRRHYELVSNFSVGLKTLLHQGLSEPEFYGDLVYKFKKIVGRADFSLSVQKKYRSLQAYWI